MALTQAQQAALLSAAKQWLLIDPSLTNTRLLVIAGFISAADKETLYNQIKSDLSAAFTAQQAQQDAIKAVLIP